MQHLESLNDVVERATGVGVRETVPDSFLKQADQVVNLDLAVEDLQERLRAGKIYAPEKIPWALEHFFKEQNLAHLRELALREVAESVERASARPVVAGAVRSAEARGRRLAQPRDGLPVVGVAARRLAGAQGLAPGGPAQHRLVRRLRRDARGVARADRRRGAAPPARPTPTSRASWAPRWCACARPIRSTAILDFARSHGVGHIVVGPFAPAARGSSCFGRSVPMRLVREAHGLDVHVVADGRGGRRA